MTSAERSKLWREKNPNGAKEYREKHKEHRKQLAKAWYLKNKTLLKARALQWKKENQDRYKQNNHKYYTNHKEIYRGRRIEWGKANKGQVNANVRQYELSKIKRTPIWLDLDDMWVIKEIYTLASIRTEMTGIKWHVDHIIPLRGKTVSGLHVPSNLQVIPAIINISKGNKLLTDN